MKSTYNLLELLKPLPHFGKADIKQLGEQLEITPATIDTYISRYLRRHDIIKLRRGLYVTTAFFEQHQADVSYTFYLANTMRQPSYVSSWTALQYYNLTTEAVRAVTSVTPKVTRRYQNKAGNFIYQSIRRDLFSGFILGEGDHQFFIATPAKALFDLLYFRTHQFRGLARTVIPVLIDELRIDFDEMPPTEQKRFYELINQHLHE